MSRIDFYLLSDTNPKARLTFTGRLVDKIYHKGHRIYIHLPSPDELRQLDDLLWTQREDSFLPHNIYGESATIVPPIQLGCGIKPENHEDILINLTLEIPDFYAQFQRVLEVIPKDNAWQEKARNNYRLYRQRGCQLESHPI